MGWRMVIAPGARLKQVTRPQPVVLRPLPCELFNAAWRNSRSLGCQGRATPGIQRTNDSSIARAKSSLNCEVSTHDGQALTSVAACVWPPTCGSLRVAAYVWQPVASTHVNWVTRRLAGTRWRTRGVADRGAPTKGRGIHSEWANPSGTCDVQAPRGSNSTRCRRSDPASEADRRVGSSRLAAADVRRAFLHAGRLLYCRMVASASPVDG